jgi:hypothetical protein
MFLSFGSGASVFRVDPRSDHLEKLRDLQKAIHFQMLDEFDGKLGLTVARIRDERLEDFLDQVQSNCLRGSISLSDRP